jgi:hypothetical protein
LEALQCKFNIKINNLTKTFRTLVVSNKQINALVRLRFNNCWPLKMRTIWEWWAYENDGPHRQHANLNLKTKIMSKKSCLKNHVWKSCLKIMSENHMSEKKVNWNIYIFLNKFWKKKFCFLNFIILL